MCTVVWGTVITLGTNGEWIFGAILGSLVVVIMGSTLGIGGATSISGVIGGCTFKIVISGEG